MKLQPKTAAKKKAQQRALRLHNELRGVIRDLEAAGAITAAKRLDSIAIRLWTWTRT
jgi:hypothetical protein